MHFFSSKHFKISDSDSSKIRITFIHPPTLSSLPNQNYMSHSDAHIYPILMSLYSLRSKRLKNVKTVARDNVCLLGFLINDY